MLNQNELIMKEKKYLYDNPKNHGLAVDRADRFEVVETFPAGYVVWNIGRHNFPFPGFIPLARAVRGNPDAIDIGSLKALRCARSDAVLRAANYERITKAVYEERMARANDD